MVAGLDRAFEGRRVCVTGGAGFIGSHLCRALVERGAEVAVIDDLSAGSRDNLKPIESRVRFVEGSVLDPAALADATGGAQLIFHQAALTSVPGSLEQPLRYHEVNCTGTLRVLEAARHVAAPESRVILASSSSVYGDGGSGAAVESSTPRPMSPYAASKGAAELSVRAYAFSYGVQGIVLRYFNIFGPRQNPDSPYAAVIPKFARALLQGEAPTIYGDGTQTRDFTHVANAVRANLLAGARPGELRGEVVNVASGATTTVRRLLEMIGGILGVRAEPVFEPPRTGEVVHSRADVSAARELLGYEPAVALEEGLKDALEYYSALYAPA